jgi:translation elongation factor EF-4
VDSTQGVEAQTLSVLSVAKEFGLTIIPVVSKIDAPHARVAHIKSELALLLGINESAILAVSGKTGEGVLKNYSTQLLKKFHRRSRKKKVCKRSFSISAIQITAASLCTCAYLAATLKRATSSDFVAAQADFTALEVGAFAR